MAADQISMVKALRQKCDDLEDEVDAANSAKEEAEEASKELQAELEVLRTKLDAAEKSSAGKDPDASGEVDKEASSAADLASLRAELEESAQRRIDELTKQLEAERAEHAKKLNSVQGDNVDDDNTGSQELQEQIDKLVKQHEAELSAQREELSRQLEAERVEHAEKFRAAQGDNADNNGSQELQEQIDKLVKEHEAELSSQREELNRQFESERAEHAEKLKAAEEGLREREQEVDDVRKSSKQLLADAAEQTEKLKATEEDRDELDGERQTLVGRLSKLAAQLDAERARVGELTKELERTTKEHATLTADLNAEVQITQGLNDTIARLKEEHAGRDAERDLELEKQRQIASDLASTVERLQQQLHEAGEAAGASGDIEAAEKLAAAEERRASELADALDMQKKRCADIEDAHRRAQEQLGSVTDSHLSERKRADEMQVTLQAMQDAHEAIFTRYSKALEDLDSLKGAKNRMEVEKAEVEKTLEEETRLRKEREAEPPPGPSQLSVSDVLIAVNFEGVMAPLEIRPWDTDTESVVRLWLTSVQRSSKLQPSIVRYVKHLEQTAEAFPIKQEAKLLEVHEQYAV